MGMYPMQEEENRQEVSMWLGKIRKTMNHIYGDKSM